MHTKHLLSLLFIPAMLALVSCSRPAGTSQHAAAAKNLKALLDQKEYFRLEQQFGLDKAKLDNENRLYFKSYLDNAFNRNSEAIADADSLLDANVFKLTDSVKAELYLLQSDSYFKIYQYAKAARCDSDALKIYAREKHTAGTDDINNDLLIRNALKDIAPQQTVIKANDSVNWKKDKIGLVEIPLTCNQVTYDGIFDTRANISAISMTYARKLGLHILNATYKEGSGITGLTFKTNIGVADSLRIGNILMKNVVFQVMPDSVLYLAPIKFQLNIIIGLPVIAQLGEVDLFRNGRMLVPQQPAKSNLHNLALNALDPVILLKSGNDSLRFYFDSGASNSTLYSTYFEKYRSTILKNGLKKNMEFGGAGGSQKKAVYILPKFSLTLAGQTVPVDSVNILTRAIAPGEKCYGNIGQDFIQRFSKLIFNFKYMYVKGIK